MPGPVPHLAMSSAKPESSLEPDAGGGGGGRSELGGLDAQLWHACAGGMVQLPRVGSKVVYFPQGHAEQAASAPEFPRSLGPLGSVPCRVVSVNFLADAETDEVFSRICLQPEPPGSSLAATQSMDDAAAAAAPASPPPAKPAAFSKTLTQSDANNGGGFSVPRYCAETIFPPLDYATDPPVQTVLAKDVHGDVWKFRHIYRGTPRRHLLTTGWSTFVNQKKLVAGDAIVFLRIASGELCVGVRRSMRGGGASSGVGESSSWHSSSVRSSPLSDFLGGHEHGYGLSTRSENNNNNQSSGSPTCSFARDRVRVTAKSVLEAAQLAIAGKPFEVVYYPRASTAEFCVEAGLVKCALDHSWYAGMRFKMAFETEDSSRISWFMGTIAAVQPIDPVMWPNSPWRVLQVAWDEPDLLPGVSRVSPWQVRLLATLPMQLPPFALPKKKPRQLPEVLPGGLPFSPSPWRTTTSTSTTTTTNSWAALTVQDDSSAGMQGARHDHFNGGLPPTTATVENFRSSSNFKRPRESPDEEEQATPHNYFSLLPPPCSRPVPVPVPVPSMQAQQGFMSEPKKNATSFFLFGQFIDPSCASKSQQQRPNNLLDKDKEKASDMIKWLQANEQGSSMRRSGPHFEVFMEGDAVGHTLELSWFNTYEELYSRLAAMFSVSMSQLQDCVVYRDVRGSVRRIGDEPFRSFVEIGRHLTILQHRANRAIKERSY